MEDLGGAGGGSPTYIYIEECKKKPRMCPIIVSLIIIIIIITITITIIIIIIIIIMLQLERAVGGTIPFLISPAFH